jgi:hypothetical protein
MESFGDWIMPSPMHGQRTHRETDPTAPDICGGALVLAIFLVPTVLEATYLGHAFRSLVGKVLTLLSPAMRGAGLC